MNAADWLTPLAFLAGVGFLAWCLFYWPRHGTVLAEDASKGEICLAALLAAALTMAVVVFGVNFLRHYGTALFLGTPVLMGFVAARLLSLRHPRSLGDCGKAAVLAVSFTGIGLLLFRVEGLICLMMALPLALPLAFFGGEIAYTLQEWLRHRNRSLTTLLLAVLCAPLLLGAEAAVAPRPPLLEAYTAIEIDAPPEVVWKHVVSFSELPPPEEWLFRAGIAYPIRAEIQGSGPGAVRTCVFSTGAFVEPIEVWSEPVLLRFAVTKNPPSMVELTPYASIKPPHIEGFFVSEKGQFELRPLPGGRTYLAGTTWYRHDLRPAFYWRMWSDAILHRIHLRVLRHIQRLSEQEVRS